MIPLILLLLLSSEPLGSHAQRHQRRHNPPIYRPAVYHRPQPSPCYYPPTHTQTHTESVVHLHKKTEAVTQTDHVTNIEPSYITEFHTNTIQEIIKDTVTEAVTITLTVSFF